MKPVKLGNEKALQLTNNLLIRELNNKITSNFNIEIENKRYFFLDKNRANELKQKEHSFVLNTFGQKYLLFLTHVNFKPYAIYINRKNGTFFLVKTRFSIELYDDTIFEGETVKINEKWYFLLSDCLVYRGEELMTKFFSQRYKRIEELLSDHYISDPYLEPFALIKKDVFNYSEIEDVKEKYIPRLPFNVNGYLFKCEENSSYDILYIFPECRNKASPTNKEESVQKVEEIVEEIKQDEKNEATFLMKVTEYPDLYEIYMFDKSKSKKARVGYAGIPNIPTSVMVKGWFSELKDGEELYAKFKKNPINEKWIPQYVVNLTN